MTQSNKKNVTGSQAIILSLLEESVDTVFGYPGGAIMPVYDAIFDYGDKINHVLTRHEQGSIHAAQAYARVTNKVGVCFTTSGPGATNLITGLTDAMMDSTPLVCITGQVTSGLLGKDAFQEADVIGLTTPCTKWNFQITKAEEIPWAVAQAFHIAQTGRPGPVVLDLAKDAQFETADFKYEKCTKVRSYVPVPRVDNSKIDLAAQLINEAKKPFLLFGQGVILSNAEAELKAFVEKTGIPSAWTLLGLSALPTNHPLNVGMLGMHGNYGPNIKTNECDLLIAVGMRFDDRVTGDVSRYAKQAKIIHIDIDAAEIGKIIPVDVPLLGDAKKVLQKLTPKVKENNFDAWLQEFKECDKTEYEKVIESDIYPKKEKLTMGEVVRRIGEKTEGNAILVTDVGQQQMIASRYFNLNNSRSNVTSGGLGTMGFGLPASVGAKIGQPDRTVVAFIGDGGFQMTIQELGTIAQYNIGVKVVILNNNFLGMVRQWQQLFFEKRYSFTRMENPNFTAIANAYGIKSKKVTERANLDAVIDEMFSDNQPYVLEVVVEKEDNVFPMVPAGSSVSDIILEP